MHWFILRVNCRIFQDRQATGLNQRRENVIKQLVIFNGFFGKFGEGNNRHRGGFGDDGVRLEPDFFERPAPGILLLFK
jgi:hypothetical protein